MNRAANGSSSGAPPKTALPISFLAAHRYQTLAVERFISLPGSENGVEPWLAYAIPRSQGLKQHAKPWLVQILSAARVWYTKRIPGCCISFHPARVQK